ncbi:hypothetical protein B484DRAFT_77057 [Ochromonadaceae sp. CCMP2298]|nr:hypothetical protein B484DRAFT_77057 [Ochromonadaceae sp. CCMP2298]
MRGPVSLVIAFSMIGLVHSFGHRLSHTAHIYRSAAGYASASASGSGFASGYASGSGSGSGSGYAGRGGRGGRGLPWEAPPSSGLRMSLSEQGVQRAEGTLGTVGMQGTQAQGTQGQASAGALALAMSFRRGQAIEVTVVQFGPMGASVEIAAVAKVGVGAVGGEGPPRGLILQKELALFRAKRGQEVEMGETLPAFVERVREDGKVDVSLRPVDRSRIQVVKAEILEALEGSPSSDIPLGDRSSPNDIASYFYGMSKRDFKNAVGSLYKEGLAFPGAFVTSLVPEGEQEYVKGGATTEAQERSQGVGGGGGGGGEGVDTYASASGSTSNYDANAKGNQYQGNRNYGNQGNQGTVPYVRRDDSTIFVGNLPSSINPTIFTNVVEKALPLGLKGVRLSQDSAGKARGFGYVEMASPELVEEA